MWARPKVTMENGEARGKKLYSYWSDDPAAYFATINIHLPFMHMHRHRHSHMERALRTDGGFLRWIRTIRRGGVVAVALDFRWKKEKRMASLWLWVWERKLCEATDGWCGSRASSRDFQFAVESKTHNTDANPPSPPHTQQALHICISHI